MFPRDAPFILLDDARDEGAALARLYKEPTQILATDQADEISNILDMVKQAASQSQHVAGYMSYEAGLALEPKLYNRLEVSPASPYLCWFGVFQGYQEIENHDVMAFLPSAEGSWRSELKPNIERDVYDRSFAQIMEYIAAGDIYQANLTFRSSAKVLGHPMALYAALRDRAKAGYGGIIFDGTHWLLSFSPELFFALKDGRVTAKPMKGTAARLADPARDKVAIETLQNDPKQRAENLMIVDLLRNDLSRLTKAGSVEVPELFAIESYPTVHQMTSTVTANMLDGLGAADLLSKIFPCGSITGAPKIRAMEVIDELEDDGRGVYCGSIGRIDAGGDAAFNVAIRTITIGDNSEKLSIGLGSGIVADSSGDDEWLECLAKGEFVRPMGESGVNSDDIGGQFDLIEAMLFDPAEGIALLERHLERLKASAKTFGFEFDRHATRNELQAVTFHQESPAKIRLLLAKSGAIAIELQPLSQPSHDNAMQVKIRHLPVDSSDFRLRHKTSDRAFYDDSFAEAGGCDQVIFVDKQGFLTEGNRTNIFVERDGKYCTPPLSRGLLPGVLRAELLESGQAIEVDLTEADLAGGFLLGNSVRGLIVAELVA